MPGLLQRVVSPTPSRQRLSHRQFTLYTLTPLVHISQGDLARPCDLPRTLEIQARALPRSFGAGTVPGRRVRLWPPQMPGPLPRVGHGVANDGQHARRVRVPSRNRCRRPPRSARAGVRLSVRLVSSQSPAPRPDAGCAD